MSIKHNTIKDIKYVYDVCIIGSGPAGLTLASELSKSGKRVCVLESGGEDVNPYTDELRTVESVGEVKIKQASRERVIGGTSTTWGGGSAPMDPIDFSMRDYMMEPIGWPFPVEVLYPYYRRLSKYGFPDFDKFNAQHTKDIFESSDIKPKWNLLGEKVFIAMDPPWNFGKKLRHIFDLPNVDLYKDATVLHISSIKIEDMSRATDVKIISSGVPWSISADFFIIAAGGLESTRLLLLSQDACVSGLGNEYDQVGRYLMNHPKNSFGVLKLNHPVKHAPYFFGYLYSGFAGYTGVRLSEDVQRKSNVLNSYIRFEPMFPWTDNEGVFAFLTLIKKMHIIMNTWKRNQKYIVHLRDYNETPDGKRVDEGSQRFIWIKMLASIFLNIAPVLQYVIHRLFPKKDLYIKAVRLRNFMEMEPRYENKMFLSKTRDNNGQRRAVVDINTSPLDRKSVVILHQIFSEEINNQGIGVLEGDIGKELVWPITLDSSHHLGGTRMGIDPKNSVVNQDLRLHSVCNVYICSGSVFPTSGCANPTYTICALAVRLADTLKKL